MLISLRIPDELLAEIDAQAKEAGRSRNAWIVRQLQGDYDPNYMRDAIARGDVVPLPKTSGKTIKMYMHEPAPKSSRPAHAIGCLCMMCKPPK